MVVVEEFIKNNLIPSMLEIDSLFGISYSSIYDSGAYYDSLRIREATEFELDLILKMPSRGNVMRVQVGNGSYGFAKYYCNSLPANMLTSTKMKESFSLIFQKRCFTSSQNVWLFPKSCWQSSQIQQVPPALLLVRQGDDPKVQLASIFTGDHPKVQLVSIFTSCHTKLKVSNDLEVDIDLVPVFTYGEEILDPETHPGEGYQKLWRLFYPSVEREQLKYQSCAKKVIR